MAQSEVLKFYADKAILLTGATGFVGKVLLEKLLRCCLDIKYIYVIMRKKKGLNPEERLKAFLMNPLFDILRQSNPLALNKVKLLPGDILLPELGLSPYDQLELQNNCNIVFHSAACVRFDQKLKDAVDLNVAGTQKVLRLCEKMKNLEVLVHLSTAYCRCELPVLEEKVYPAAHPPDRIIDMVQWMNDGLLQHLESEIIKGEPNTYSYTKAVTESLVDQYSSSFPIAIARPSIVTAMWQEPIPGWVDNFNGPTGLLVGAGKGVIRSMHCEPTYQSDAVPVDVVSNGCILIAYATAKDRSKKTQVFNITLSRAVEITWGEIINEGRRKVNEYPFLTALWYPGGSIKSYKWTHQIAVVFTHYLPAYGVDLLMLLVGKKTFMVKLQDRINYGIQILTHYTQKEWQFSNEAFKSLTKRIPKVDREMFYIDMSSLHIDTYLKNYILGVRQYCCKEDPSTLSRARKIHRIRYIADLALNLFIFMVIAWILYSNMDFIFNGLEALDEKLSSISPFRTVKALEIEEL